MLQFELFFKVLDFLLQLCNSSLQFLNLVLRVLQFLLIFFPQFFRSQNLFSNLTNLRQNIKNIFFLLGLFLRGFCLGRLFLIFLFNWCYLATFFEFNLTQLLESFLVVKQPILFLFFCNFLSEFDLLNLSSIFISI